MSTFQKKHTTLLHTCFPFHPPWPSSASLVHDSAPLWPLEWDEAAGMTGCVTWVGPGWVLSLAHWTQCSQGVAPEAERWGGWPWGGLEGPTEQMEEGGVELVGEGGGRGHLAGYPLEVES